MQARVWAEEANVPHDRILLTYADRNALMENLGLHDDGRNYALPTSATHAILTQFN